MQIVHDHLTSRRTSQGPLIFVFALILAVVAAVGFAGYSWWTAGSATGLTGQGTGRGRVSAKIVDGLDPEMLVVTGPGVLKDVSGDDARAINAAIPIFRGANPEAKAFVLPAGVPGLWTRSVECLAAAVYYEAATEPLEGQQAVAQVVLNRMRHPVYPHNVCGVVFEGSERQTGCQFSFTCDGSLARRPIPALWERSRRVAMAALAGFVYQPVGWATHYHADYVAPYWAPSLTKVGVIGRHIFYRWAGAGGKPAAFTGQYEGREPDSWGTALEAMMVPETTVPGGPAADVAMTERPILSQAGSVMAEAAASGTPAPAGAARPAIRQLSDIRSPQPLAKDDVPTGSRWVIGGMTRAAGAPNSDGTVPDRKQPVLPQLSDANVAKTSARPNE